jgi:long-chain acyl-CoA synthetase
MNRGEAETLARKVGSALSNLKMVEPVPGDEKFQKEFKFFGIYAKNRPEWVIADIASALYGYTVIPLYDTLGADAMAHVFKQTQCSTVLSSGDNVGKLLKGVADKSYISLKNIVSFDELKPETIQEAGKLGVNIFDWKDFVLNGEQKPVEYAKNIPSEHVFTFNYTSGTTSLPKAVVLTHRNVLGAIGGYNDLRFEEVTTNCGPGDFYLSYLPLAHVLERMFIHQMCFKGCAIGFYNGDPFKLDQDLLALRPTIFTAVPRILNRFYDKIKKKLDELHGIKKDLAEKAIQTKMENLRAGEGYTHFIYDRLVFSSMKAAIGGRVKVILSGGAPLSHEIGEFLKICFCCPIVEGYGLTETAACGTMQIPLDWESSKVGGVVPCVEIKLVEIPEMNYLLSDKTDGEVCPRGEFCIRGTTVFKGYYKDDKETQAVLDVDGWLHTGDVGRINKDGSLSIIDRKKNIFKLAQGEYIAPDKIENIYL